MKGLLWKDSLLMWKNFKLYGLVCLLFFVMIVFTDSNQSLIIYPTLLVGAIPVNLINMDERSGWDVYSAALPLSRGQLVSAKYLLALLNALALLLLYALALAGRALYAPGGPGELAALFPFLLCCMLLAPAVMLPCLFKFGYQKGNLLYLVFLGVFAGSAVGVMATLDAVSGGRLSQMGQRWLSLLPLAAAALFALSWRLSIGIYRKKDL